MPSTWSAVWSGYAIYLIIGYISEVLIYQLGLTKTPIGQNNNNSTTIALQQLYTLTA